MTLVPDAMVQDAFDWLQGAAKEAGRAKAERIRAEHGVKQVRSKLFMAAAGTVAEREAVALASPEYDAAVERLAKAVGLDDWHHNQRNKCTAIIEAWRTEQSNLRAMTKVG